MKFIDNKLFFLTLFFLWGKFILYQKIGLSYFYYIKTENDFFPELLYLINPFYLDILIILALLMKKNYFLIIGMILSFLEIIHPQSFGVQNYVVSFYILVWLFINNFDKLKPQIFLGRLVISFIFIGAFIGKITPGWITDYHPDKYLKHIQNYFNIPYIFLIGEFLVGISFILPFRIGILVPILTIFGMIFSISFGIFDAVGPLLGLSLTLILFKYHNSNVLTIYFDQNCGICMKVYKLFNFLNSRYLNLSYLSEITKDMNQNKSYVFIASKSGDNQYYGYDTYCEIFARVPVLSIFYPILKLRTVTKIGKSIYLKVSNTRSCKIN
jgi:hypothetical protein